MPQRPRVQKRIERKAEQGARECDFADLALRGTSCSTARQRARRKPGDHQRVGFRLGDGVDAAQRVVGLVVARRLAETAGKCSELQSGNGGVSERIAENAPGSTACVGGKRQVADGEPAPLHVAPGMAPALPTVSV